MGKKIIVTILSVIGIIVLVGAGLIYYFFKSSETGFHKDGGKVFYYTYGISREEVIGADYDSFETLPIGDGQLGKDKNKMYLFQTSFPADLDRSTFQLLPSNQSWKRFYSRDKNRAYYAVHVLEGAAPDALEILGDGYSKDKSFAYYQETKLEDVNVATFKPIGSLYASDGKKVFYTKHLIPGADAATFKASEDEDYAHDKNHSYQFEVPGNVVDGQFVPSK